MRSSHKKEGDALKSKTRGRGTEKIMTWEGISAIPTKTSRKSGNQRKSQVGRRSTEKIMTHKRVITIPS